MPRATKKQVMCERKEPHYDLSTAKLHLERLKGIPDVTDVERLHIYWCPYPDAEGRRHQHVGHRRKIQQRFLEQKGIL